MHSSNFRHFKSRISPAFGDRAQTCALLLLMLAALAASLPAVASNESEAAAQAADEAEAQIKNANRQVLEQIRAGNRDTQHLMKLMGPALKARTEALEKKAKIDGDEAERLALIEKRKERAKSGPKNKGAKGTAKTAKDTKDVRPTNPSNSLNGASRYGGSGPNDAPIMDPNSVPKELTFEKSAAKTKVVPTTQSMPPIPDVLDPEVTTATGTGGVDEIQFEVQPKPVAEQTAKPKRGR